jgi:Xaa-Pro dipeptidase
MAARKGWSGMAGYIDRVRASTLMLQRGIDALILCEPEAFRYATSASPGPASLFRRAGASFAVIPQRPELPVAAVVTDFDAKRIGSAAPELILRTHPCWIESIFLESKPQASFLEQQLEHAAQALGRPDDFSRPATFDISLAVAELVNVLSELGLSGGRLGLDLDFVPAADFQQMAALMGGFALSNGSPVLDRMRAVKSDREIALLKFGIEYSELGYKRMEADACTGMRVAELIGLYRAGVDEASAGSGHGVSTAEFLTLGALPRTVEHAAEPGDPLKADMVCSVDGYQADMSRNFVFGPPSPEQARLHAIAEEAFETGLAALRPGKLLSDVHRAASEGLARNGLRSYRRGHFGHGVGLSVFSEQWPFIAADSDVEIEPGMVLAFEIPLYVGGLASFNLEDQFLITDDGAVSMNSLPRNLGSLG